MRSLLLFGITFLFSLSANAHQFLPTEAKLTLLSEKDYVLNIDLDVVELLQQELDINAEKDALIVKVRSLSKYEIHQALDSSREKFIEQLFLHFDGHEQKVDKFIFPPAAYVKRILKGDPSSTEYRMVSMSRGKIPQNTENISITFPKSLGNIKLTINSPKRVLVAPGLKSPSYNLYGRKSSNGVSEIGNYFVQGIVHIIPKGIDHILFILALFFMSTNFRSLIIQITVFTIAHSITLILASYQIVNVPTNIVEPLIALSIALVAFENLIHNKIKAWRMAIIFAFGLLHGMGFASVLLDLGLPENQTFLSLLAFNIGIEIAQIFIVLCSLALVARIKTHEWYHRRVVLPVSALIAAIGIFWTAERIIDQFPNQEVPSSISQIN